MPEIRDYQKKSLQFSSAAVASPRFPEKGRTFSEGEQMTGSNLREASLFKQPGKPRCHLFRLSRIPEPRMVSSSRECALKEVDHENTVLLTNHFVHRGKSCHHEIPSRLGRDVDICSGVLLVGDRWPGRRPNRGIEGPSRGTTTSWAGACLWCRRFWIANLRDRRRPLLRRQRCRWVDGLVPGSSGRASLCL